MSNLDLTSLQSSETARRCRAVKPRFYTPKNLVPRTAMEGGGHRCDHEYDNGLRKKRIRASSLSVLFSIRCRVGPNDDQRRIACSD